MFRRQFSSVYDALTEGELPESELRGIWGQFRSRDDARPADRTADFILTGQKIRLAAWHGPHLCKLPALVGMVLRVEFLKADDTPRYKTPLYLFWTGPLTVPLEALCRWTT